MSAIKTSAETHSVKKASEAQSSKASSLKIQSSLRTGAEIVIDCLAAEGVEHIWGYPGGAVLYIYDAIFKQDKVKHILVRHEQAAVHAADAYSRCSDDVGVALVTSGPGLTNAVTGLATAYMDSIPLVVISGQVPSPVIGQDAFQECDSVGITRPCVKHNFLVKNVEDLAMTMKKAFYIARTGRPGPVLVDIPKDITIKKTSFDYSEEVFIRSYQPSVKGHIGQIKKALKIIKDSKRLLVYAGGGIVLANCAEQLRALVERFQAPCTNTLMGLGAFPASHPDFLGMLGMHGTYEANLSMQNCDVLIAVGARFDDRVIGNPKNFALNPRKIIHIDVDPSSISKRVKVDVPIVGDVKSVLEDMLKLSENMEFSRQEDWQQQIAKWRERKCLAYKASKKEVRPQYVIEQLHKVTKGQAYITSDVGQHQMWAAQYYGFDAPKRWLNSGGLGTMGVGLPYAMGVKMKYPDADVACITGEGSLQMCIQELATCKQYGLAPKIILLNNGYLGMVRQWQELDYSSRYAESYMDSLPNFDALAQSFGHIGVTIDKAEDVKEALEDAFAMKDKLVLLNFITNREENVWPMVKAGCGLGEMLLGSEDL